MFTIFQDIREILRFEPDLTYMNLSDKTGYPWKTIKHYIVIMEFLGVVTSKIDMEGKRVFSLTKRDTFRQGDE